jgi:catechol 2,3-dioxygenase-like lactoylglutathione lyase family enzyme
MTYVEIGVTDLARSEEFYGGLLGLAPGPSGSDADGRRVRTLRAGPAEVRLVEVGAEGLENNWSRDDLQCGIRHFGLKVTDIDGWVSRLKAADVPFALDPLDAFGDVRIAFFFDPDGAYLEFVQGYVNHNKLWSRELVDAEVAADKDWDGSPRFDHIAVTVPDLDEALAYYRDELGLGVAGQLVREDDPRGFLITNLRSLNGAGTLEVFTYGEPTHRRDGVGEPDRIGLRSFGLEAKAGVPAGSAVGPGDVPLVVA